ncbi:2-aminoethanethiol dioxygenase [Symbiodinium microadriaticum]|uniref:2-aminoethanethiol dioxygenase n=1 Tax=Symbiodinium microadriaticum TaxID=2951 RepID=A0A1Q9DE42_SYMMI|nr:2-aminoethanethiol dioxygenase [Symbiodinium microadriaticum]
MLARERRNLPAMRPELADVLLAKLERVQARLFEGPDICQQLPPSAAVGYIEVGQTREVTLCVFVLKKGASLPLHDHPGMHVFGRLLFGRMLAVSVDA